MCIEKVRVYIDTPYNKMKTNRRVVKSCIMFDISGHRSKVTTRTLLTVVIAYRFIKVEDFSHNGRYYCHRYFQIANLFFFPLRQLRNLTNAKLENAQRLRFFFFEINCTSRRIWLNTNVWLMLNFRRSAWITHRISYYLFIFIRYFYSRIPMYFFVSFFP